MSHYTRNQMPPNQGSVFARFSDQGAVDSIVRRFCENGNAEPTQRELIEWATENDLLITPRNFAKLGPVDESGLSHAVWFAESSLVVKRTWNLKATSFRNYLLQILALNAIFEDRIEFRGVYVDALGTAQIVISQPQRANNEAVTQV